MATTNYGLTTISSSDNLANFPTAFNANMNAIDAAMMPTITEKNVNTESAVVANAWVNIGDVSLSKGKYLVTVPDIRPISSDSNIHTIYLAVSTISSGFNGNSNTAGLAVNGKFTNLGAFVMDVSSPATYHLWVFHTDSTNSYISLKAQFVKIG